VSLAFAARYGLQPTGRTFPARESRMWQVQHAARLAILRRLDPTAFPPGQSWARSSVAWLHRFLSRLAEAGFPGPQPIAAFDGCSWMETGDALWELVSYLPGEIVGWRAPSSLAAIGAFLARYHKAAGGVGVDAQRPAALAIESLPRTTVARELRGRLEELADDLERIGHGAAPRLVIHGDFTAHNVLVADWKRPEPTGVIDFALAYVDTPLADVGFGLWRSGRPYQEAIRLDQSRVHAFVAGYARHQALPSAAADAIAVYIRARGIQHAAKAAARGKPLPPIVAQRIDWLAAHQAELRDVAAEAIARAGISYPRGAQT
jgi:Ser/Thr protein kinase RdoA (MazF antagonist)